MPVLLCVPTQGKVNAEQNMTKKPDIEMPKRDMTILYMFLCTQLCINMYIVRKMLCTVLLNTYT